MALLKNNRLIRALRREPVDTTPVWIMRQAGRYLPEYRDVRSRAKTFMNLCRTPELACEVTLQPLARYDLDAAIIFSDILTIPDAMGLGLFFETNEGPRFDKPVRSQREIYGLTKPDIEDDLGYVMDAIKLVVKELDQRIPLIGFAGSPWTLATYMVEGGSSKNFQTIKQLLYFEPTTLHHLLILLADTVSDYLIGQIKAGVSAVMIFDTWGGVLTTESYLEFSLRYLEKITRHIKQHYPDIPIILFTKNGAQWLHKIADTNCDAIGVDWTVELSYARKIVGDRVALQGNLDPAVLYASPQTIRDHVQKVLQSYGAGSGHVFNLGHGIYPDIQPENVKTLVDAVHEFGKQYQLT